MIQRIETMHSLNFIHRDIKPENFLIGAGKKSNTIFCIDFGLSKRFKCPKTGQHIEKKKRLGITGTPRYCSLNAHQSNE
jgi:serine/threonine protein kinase